MAGWLCSGLQIRVPRFDSELRLQYFLQPGIVRPRCVLGDRRRDKAADVCDGKESIPASLDIFDFILPVKVNLNTETAWQGTANTAAIFSVDRKSTRLNSSH